MNPNDLSKMSDQELLNLESSLNGGQRDLSKLSNEQLLLLDQQSGSDSFRDPNTVSDNGSGQSPISFIDRMKLSFADDAGRENYLKNVKGFKYVEKLGNGKFAVGNDMRIMTPIDPEGFLNDIPGDFADVVASIPMIAGQIGGAAMGAIAGPTGAIGGAIAGGSAGEALSKGIGKSLGVNKQNPESMAVDIALSGLLSGVGEGVGLGAKALGSKVVSPMLGRMLDTAAATTTKIDPVTGLPGSVQASPFVKTMAKLFKLSANVKEDSTIDAAKHGFTKTFSTQNMDKRTIVPIVRDMVEGINTTTESLGKEVGKATDNLVTVARRSGKSANIPVDDLFQTLKKDATDLGILDSFGVANPLDVTPQSKVIKNLLSELGDTEYVNKTVAGKSYKLPRYSNAEKTFDAKKAIRISRAYGQKFGDMSPEGEQILYKVLNGDKTTGSPGIRPRLSKLASDLGLADYAKANEQFSSFLSLKDRVHGLQSKNLADIESFVKNYENFGEFAKADLRTLDNMSSKKFLDRLEMWNAAQDFTSANPSMLRLGAMAGLAGASTGGGTWGDRAKRFGVGMAIGTPMGIRQILRSGEAVGSGVAKGLLSSGRNEQAQGVLRGLLSANLNAQRRQRKQQ